MPPYNLVWLVVTPLIVSEESSDRESVRHLVTKIWKEPALEVCSIALSIIESNIVGNILQQTDSYYKVQGLSWKGHPEGYKNMYDRQKTNNR